MDGYMVIRKFGSDFDANECARQFGNLQAAVDPVVVGESDKSHPLFPQPMVKGARSRIAIREIEPAEKPLRRSVAKPRMEMEIDFGSHPNFLRRGQYLTLYDSQIFRSNQSLSRTPVREVRRVQMTGNKLLIRQRLPVLQGGADHTLNMRPNGRYLTIGRMNPDTQQRLLSEPRD